MSYVDNWNLFMGHGWDAQRAALKAYVDAGVKASDVLAAAQAVKNHSLVTSNVTAWAALTAYVKGQLVTFNGSTWMASASFTSGSTFDPANWTLATPGGFGFPSTIDFWRETASDAQNVGTANGALYLRCRDGGALSAIALVVAVQSGNISVGAYRTSGAGRNAVPGALLASSGAIACPAVGTATISLGSTVTMLPGDWLAISADNVTATFRAHLGNAVDNTLATGRLFRQPTAHPLPSTPSALIANAGRHIVLTGA